MITRCLREVNARDYPAEVIDGLAAQYAPARVRALAAARAMLVAEVDGAIAGTVSRDGSRVFTLFIDPAHSGQGLGRQLMDRVEQDAAAAGFAVMETAASITAHGFYARRGYAGVRESRTEFGLTFVMRKTRPAGAPLRQAGAARGGVSGGSGSVDC